MIKASALCLLVLGGVLWAQAPQQPWTGITSSDDSHVLKMTKPTYFTFYYDEMKMMSEPPSVIVPKTIVCWIDAGKMVECVDSEGKSRTKEHAAPAHLSQGDGTGEMRTVITGHTVPPDFRPGDIAYFDGHEFTKIEAGHGAPEPIYVPAVRESLKCLSEEYLCIHSRIEWTCDDPKRTLLISVDGSKAVCHKLD